jgi:peptidoglycan-associated lipoprotein
MHQLANSLHDCAKMFRALAAGKAWCSALARIDRDSTHPGTAVTRVLAGEMHDGAPTNTLQEKTSMVRKIPVLLGIILIATAACGSSQKKSTAAGDSSAAATGSERPDTATQRVETAQGDMRDVLIALQRVHFGFDSSQLSESSRAALAEAAKKLATRPDVHLYVDGHADERGTGEYNIALGERRARTVSEYLTRMGVSPDNLHVVSFGKEQPMAAGSDSLAHAKNRRVDFRLMRGDVRLVIEEGTPLDDRGEASAAGSRTE